MKLYDIAAAASSLRSVGRTNTSYRMKIIDDIEVLTKYAADKKLDGQDEDVRECIKLLSIANDQADNKEHTDSILSDDQFDDLLVRASRLAPENPEVTIDSLKTTRFDTIPNFIFNPLTWYVLFQWVIVVMALAAILFMEYQFRFASYSIYDPAVLKFVEMHMLPYLYGLLGSIVNAMNITGIRMRDRTFDISRIPSHINNMILGAISGGIIFLFISPEQQTILTSSEENRAFVLTATTLAFVAGYRVELLFEALGRVLSAILPSIKN